jgi:hypothetical protein
MVEKLNVYIIRVSIYAIVEYNFFVHSFSVELLGVFRPPKNNDFVVQVNGLWTTVPILGVLRYSTP